MFHRFMRGAESWFPVLNNAKMMSMAALNLTTRPALTMQG
jgi:hypothetical protein